MRVYVYVRVHGSARLHVHVRVCLREREKQGEEIETLSSLLMRLLRTKQNLIKMQIASSFTIGVKCRFLSQGD